jgi:hydrogenase nickel incorporation protein HypA/HybF
VHELSLCEAIVDTVARYADARPVRRVNVRIGYLRQVVPDALQFSWELLTEGRDLAGSELVIEHVPAVVVCTSCGAETTLDWPILVCATCGTHDVQLVSGEEFMIESIDLAEPENAVTGGADPESPEEVADGSLPPPSRRDGA